MELKREYIQNMTNEVQLEQFLERTRRNHFWVGGIDGQLAVRKLKIGIAGLGGMGANIAEIFARLGVGYLRITDPDIIERSNLNRQVIANEKSIGMKKSIASAEELKTIASDIQIDYSTEGISSNNANAFVDGLDVVINEIDVFHIDKQLLLIEAAHRKGISVYTTLVVGLGIHLYKYDPYSVPSAQDFLGLLTKNKSAKALVDRLGEPLPSYLSGPNLDCFLYEIEKKGVPIFGASTYLGQSLLAIRVLNDKGLLRTKDMPKTPSFPRFLILDPLLLEFSTAEVKKDGTIIKL